VKCESVPHFLDSQSQMDVALPASGTGRPLLPTTVSSSLSSTLFCSRLSKLQSLVQIQRLGKLINIHVMGFEHATYLAY
jgi:hypothetical protein